MKFRFFFKPGKGAPKPQFPCRKPSSITRLKREFSISNISVCSPFVQLIIFLRYWKIKKGYLCCIFYYTYSINSLSELKAMRLSFKCRKQRLPWAPGVTGQRQHSVPMDFFLPEKVPAHLPLGPCDSSSLSELSLLTMCFAVIFSVERKQNNWRISGAKIHN